MNFENSLNLTEQSNLEGYSPIAKMEIDKLMGENIEVK